MKKEVFEIVGMHCAGCAQNLMRAFGYNTVLIPVAAGLFVPFGITVSPIFAAVAMAFSSLSVVLNSLRLKRL